jgi:hypothetical protein
MFHGHGDGFRRLRAVTDELNSFSFRLWVLHKLLKSSFLVEEFNGILQMDAVTGGVPVAFVESTIFSFFDPLPLLRWSFGRLDASFRKIATGCVLGEVTVGSLAFPSSFAFLLFLLEWLFGGFSSRFLLPGVVEVVRIQLFFIGDVDLGDR